MADRPDTLANILANGEFTTSDVLDRMPSRNRLAGMFSPDGPPMLSVADYLRSRQGVLTEAQAAAVPEPREPNVLGRAMSHIPSEAMFAANFIAPNVRLPRIPNPIKAYHGSPHDFDEFVTPAFFSLKEGVAKQYRREGGGHDNLNGLGGRGDTSEGYYWAHKALDDAGQNRAKAIEALEQEIKRFSTPTPHNYQDRSIIDVALGRPAKLKPEFEEFVQRHTALNRAGMDYLKSDAPLGKVYEAQLPAPTAHYDGHQLSDIADAIAKGHKVITWGGRTGGGGEIIALDKNVIEILKKYGIAAPVAAPTLANMLQENKETP